MILFSSRTGNVRSIVSKLGLPSLEFKSNHNQLILNDDLDLQKPFVLFTYTDGLGSIPKSVEMIMNYGDNKDYIRAVIVSGNTNFGINYCLAGDKISKQYNVPLLEKFDLRGQPSQLESVRLKYKNIME